MGRHRLTHQDVLDFIFATLDVVEHHVLVDVLPVLQFVHLIVGVGVEHRPAQELSQRLGEKTLELHSPHNQRTIKQYVLLRYSLVGKGLLCVVCSSVYLQPQSALNVQQPAPQGAPYCRVQFI